MEGLTQEIPPALEIIRVISSARLLSKAAICNPSKSAFTFVIFAIGTVVVS